MRLRLTLTALAVVAILAAPVSRPPVGGAEPIPTPYLVYLPLVVAPPPTPTATATQTVTPTVTPTPTRTPSAACMGDEELSFAPNPGATGAPLLVSVTSSRPSVYVVMQVLYDGAGVALTGPTVTGGGKGFIWTWAFTPSQPGRYDASFYVNNSDFCAGGLVQVTGAALPTATGTATATSTATATPTVTPTPTRPPSVACMGDEAMSFAPNPGATGAPLFVSVTSARASVYVVMQVAYGGAGVALAGPTVNGGGKGYIWTWTLTPYQPGRYDASFYVNNSDFCAGGFVQVQGNPVATPTAVSSPTSTATPTRTPPATATPTAAPTAPPGSVVWDWRLTFLRVGISGASVAPGQKYWRVTKGIFQNHEEGGGGVNISVDVLGEDGQRLNLGVGTVVGVVNGSPYLTWDAKPPDVYPMNFPMGPNSLGAYTIWLTFEGLPSERVYGMGLVASDGTDAPLLAEPGSVHVNYLITFRRTTRTALGTELAPGLLDCYPGWLWRPSLPNQETEPGESDFPTSPLRLQRRLITPGPACHWFGP